MKKQILKRAMLITAIGTPAVLTTTYLANQYSISQYATNDIQSNTSADQDLVQSVSVKGLRQGYDLGESVSFTVEPIWKPSSTEKEIKWAIGIFFGRDYENKKDPTFTFNNSNVSFKPLWAGTYRVVVTMVIDGKQQYTKGTTTFNVYSENMQNTEQTQESGLAWWIWLVIGLSAACLIGLITMFILNKTGKKKNAKKQVKQMKQSNVNQAKGISTTKTISTTTDTNQQNIDNKVDDQTNQAK